MRLPILFVALILSSSAYAGVVPCDVSGPECIRTIHIVPNGELQVLSTHHLNEENDDITQAVIMIHGIDRGYLHVFAEMNTLVHKGALPGNTLIVVPRFQATEDHPPAGMLYWDSENWPAGDDSLDGTKTSSFTALDELVWQIAASGNFPSLKNILITGLSAGGQTTQRYAAGNSMEGLFPSIHFRYIVAAPSSYMYLNADRWVPGTQYQFAKPNKPACNYDGYRYGIVGRNAYMNRKTDDKLIHDYISRDVNYIVGALDDATTCPAVQPVPYDNKDSMDLDMSCESEYQGASRLQRSFIFNQYMNVEFPGNQHKWLSGAGIAHEDRLYEDPGVEAILFP